ncbi:MAG: Mov34/MPN/PAD-1 family protein [Candidatus Subteraquimicrobiales bacterium]|nr:Mov34/MPN/PAD-1 family protein [Candidatus Subteraquimicrobiales bacterium]
MHIRNMNILEIEKKFIYDIESNVKKDPAHECGGFLLGKLCQNGNNVLGIVEAVISIPRIGSAGDFQFTADDILDAVIYARSNNLSYLGTFHSHGTSDAFISGVDRRFLNQRRGKEFMLVLSPSHNNFKCIYKDEHFNIFENIKVKPVETFISILIENSRNEPEHTIEVKHNEIAIQEIEKLLKPAWLKKMKLAMRIRGKIVRNK